MGGGWHFPWGVALQRQRSKHPLSDALKRKNFLSRWIPYGSKDVGKTHGKRNIHTLSSCSFASRRNPTKSGHASFMKGFHLPDAVYVNSNKLSNYASTCCHNVHFFRLKSQGGEQQSNEDPDFQSEVPETRTELDPGLSKVPSPHLSAWPFLKMQMHKKISCWWGWGGVWGGHSRPEAFSTRSHSRKRRCCVLSNSITGRS